MRRVIISGGHIATVNAAGDEFTVGHVVIDDSVIAAIGPGPAPEWASSGDNPDNSPGDWPVEYVDASGCLVTPGLINTHHHLYQWLTRGWAQDAILFDWLTALYPAWSRIDAELTGTAALGAMGVLARSGCTTVSDHHYVFPHGSGDIVGAIVESATSLGVRLHATRGSMDLGASDGGLPPDFAVESTDAALAATAEAVQRYHDPSPGSMVQVAVAPCSPFSVTADLLRESAVQARDLGVRMHTHGSETVEEDRFTREKFGMTPTDYLETVGWLGPDVWMAHCVHLDDSAVAKFAATGTGVAHCPSSNGRLAAGIAPIPQLLAAGAPVGLGVDGAASNESGQLGTEIRNSLLVNRIAWGADSYAARDVLGVATIGGARVLGRESEIGSLEPGKQADVVVWRIDGLEFAGIADPVAALTLGALPPIDLLLVAGRPVVQDSQLVNVDEAKVASDVVVASTELANRAAS